MCGNCYDSKKKQDNPGNQSKLFMMVWHIFEINEDDHPSWPSGRLFSLTCNVTRNLSRIAGIKDKKSKIVSVIDERIDLG